MINRANALSGDRGYLNGDNAIPADAFIFPDDPLVLDKFRAALIHPDDPLTPREEEGGIVVGMDGSTKLEALGVKSRVVCKSERKLLDASVRLPWRPPSVREA